MTEFCSATCLPAMSPEHLHDSGGHTGLLATRAEVVAHRPDGSTEHVAEARAGSAAWITALSPALAVPLAALLRAAADTGPRREAEDLARALLARLA
ncbi:MAG: GCN5-related N-acetyltransferase [Frankiales bacterium]|nr:GCN5-related N-acetyltransferase [Frankiales bacterium]